MEYVLLPAFISLNVTYFVSITMREGKCLAKVECSARVTPHN